MTTDWIQFFTFLLATGGSIFALIKGWQIYQESGVKKAEIKSKDALQISKDQVEIAKHTSLTTSQAVDILREYNEMKDSLEDMKKQLENSHESSEQKIGFIKEGIERVQRLLEHNSNIFTEFLANQVKLTKH